MKQRNPNMYIEVEFDEEKLIKLGKSIDDAIIEIDFICWKAGLLNIEKESINPCYYSVEEGTKGLGKILFVDDKFKKGLLWFNEACVKYNLYAENPKTKKFYHDSYMNVDGFRGYWGRKIRQSNPRLGLEIELDTEKLTEFNLEPYQATRAIGRFFSNQLDMFEIYEETTDNSIFYVTDGSENGLAYICCALDELDKYEWFKKSCLKLCLYKQDRKTDIYYYEGDFMEKYKERGIF